MKPLLLRLLVTSLALWVAVELVSGIAFTGKPLDYQSQGSTYRLTSVGPVSSDERAVNGRLPVLPRLKRSSRKTKSSRPQADSRIRCKPILRINWAWAGRRWPCVKRWSACAIVA